jgi:hypothetical protein
MAASPLTSLSLSRDRSGRAEAALADDGAAELPRWRRARAGRRPRAPGPPKPEPGWVLIEVKAFGLNRSELKYQELDASVGTLGVARAGGGAGAAGDVRITPEPCSTMGRVAARAVMSWPVTAVLPQPSASALGELGELHVVRYGAVKGRPCRSRGSRRPRSPSAAPRTPRGQGARCTLGTRQRRRTPS